MMQESLDLKMQESLDLKLATVQHQLWNLKRRQATIEVDQVELDKRWRRLQQLIEAKQADYSRIQSMIENALDS